MKILRGIDRRIQNAVGNVGDMKLGTVTTASPLTVTLDTAASAAPASKLTSCPTLTEGERVAVYVFRKMLLVHGPWE